MNPAVLASRNGLAPAPAPQPLRDPHPQRRTVTEEPQRSTRPCGICSHPEEGHGVRYAALPGFHTWAAQRRLPDDRL